MSNVPPAFCPNGVFAVKACLVASSISQKRRRRKFRVDIVF